MRSILSTTFSCRLASVGQSLFGVSRIGALPRFSRTLHTQLPLLQQAAPPANSLENRETTKHVLSRKTFLVDYYKYLNDSNDIILYVHHNNLMKNDTLKVRTDLQKLGVKLTYIRNNLYNVYLRSANEDDPALKVNTEKNKDVIHPLSPLLNGPTAIISIPTCDPSVVSQVLKVLKQAGEKLFLIGARVESAVYSVSQVDEFQHLPTKDQLQSQLAGLLSILGGAGLVKTLESNGTMLYLTLGQRKKDLGGEDETEKEN